MSCSLHENSYPQRQRAASRLMRAVQLGQSLFFASTYKRGACLLLAGIAKLGDMSFTTAVTAEDFSCFGVGSDFVA